MSWQLGLSRFIHGRLSHAAEPSSALSARTLPLPAHAGLKPRGAFTVDREASLLPALICAMFNFEGRAGTWPPTRVVELLDLAGLDRANSALHHQGPNFPSRYFRGFLPRGCRQTLLLEGLAALDSGLFAETGALFEGLSPTLRGYVLSAFERGELGMPQEAAERFMDCLVETVTFAFLNWELELNPLPDDLTADTKSS